MWAELMRAPNRFIADTWRELLFAEGISVRIVPEDGAADAGALAPVLIYVPDSKTHVAREILRKV